MSDLKTMSTSKYYQQVRMHQFDFPRPTVKMKQQAQRILCHFSKRFFSCIVRKMRIAAGVSSPHDCHAVQHREHLIRLQRVIPSNCTPGKRRISHTVPRPNHMNFRALYQTTYRKKGSRIRISTKEAVTSTGIGRVPLLRHAAI
jgi:hypothetical protein